MSNINDDRNGTVQGTAPRTIIKVIDEADAELSEAVLDQVAGGKVQTRNWGWEHGGWVST